jgi:uncharacterized protein YbaR (Trm112 family)
MAISSTDFIALLRCPSTGGRLRPATREELTQLGVNPIGGALVCEDSSTAYPVYGDIPALLSGEAIPVRSAFSPSLHPELPSS